MNTQTSARDDVVPGMDPTGPDALREAPKVSGDLTGVLQSAPMFRRALAGYDRFEVDTYVRWSEEELATAEREREHLMVRHLNTVTALDDARRLLDHSSGGREFLGTSRRIGTLLAAAADEAEGIRADAEAERAAAAEAAAQLAERAARALADADDEAARRMAAASTGAAALLADARRAAAEAEQARAALREESERHLTAARLTARTAEEDADLLRRRAAEQVLAAHLQARDETVRMLSTGLEERRRADDEAAAERARLDSAATARRSAVLADVQALEARVTALRAQAGATAEQPPVAGSRLDRFAAWLGVPRAG
jgi:colicin import membrane protein